MTNFSPGWNISLGTKYEEESQENQNGAENTNRENRGIDSLVLSQFGLLAALNVQLFEMVTVYEMMELKRNLSVAAYLWGRKTYFQKTRTYLQARRVQSVHGSVSSWHGLVLFNPFQTGGRGFSTPPPPSSGKIVITPTLKELWRSNFLTFPNIYLGKFWYNYYVHAINHLFMATSFWHMGFGKCKKMVILGVLWRRPLCYDRRGLFVCVSGIARSSGRNSVGLHDVSFRYSGHCCFEYM